MAAGSKFVPRNCGLLPGNLDEIIEKGISFSLIKHDLSTTVGIFEVGEEGPVRSLLVKRFNHRGFLDFMIHRIFNGRAKRLWNRNVRLYRRGLPVPEPITYIESSLKKKNAYFVSSVIPDSKSLYFLHREGVLQGNKVLVKKLAAAISQWHLSGAIHGDLKWPNILVRAENGVYECFFIDLDQAKICSRPNISGICGDIERFYRFGLQIGAEYWVETEFLPEYLSFMPAALRTEIDLTRIKNKSIKEWTKRGREKL